MSIQDTHFFDHGAVQLAWRTAGSGEPILLLHGFASSSIINWDGTGWTKFLCDAGYQVILLDQRGHGKSTKLYDPAAYYPEKMAEDAIALIEYLGLSKVHLMGYSMGARVSAVLAYLRPDLVQSLVLAGLGINLIRGTGDWHSVAKALLAPDVTQISDQQALMFRKFAEHSHSDLRALAACVETSKTELSLAQVQQITAPTLIVVGTEDEIAGSPEELADLMPKAEAVAIERRDHMLTVGDKLYKKATLNFLINNRGAH